jgi:hypothetical protein
MNSAESYGQMDFNLPHDVVKLPTKGLFYRPKKESLKVGYLTANDENMLMSPNISSDGIVYSLLKNKIYEPGFDVNQLLNVDVQAILIFLRNTSFGSEYNFSVTDPATNKKFDITLQLEELNVKKAIHEPNEDGFFTFQLPKTKKNVKFRLLNLKDEKEIDSLSDSYPQNMVAPVVTKRLEKHIVEIDGNTDKSKISEFILNMPISDSKDLKKFIKECEPQLDLTRYITAPSGEKVTVNLSFGVEFFRPFFQS